MITVIQNLFISNSNTLSRWLKSFLSFKNFYDKDEVVSIYFTGYVSKSMQDEVEKNLYMMKNNVNKVKKLYDNNNNGKSVNVNRVIVEYWDDISEAVIILDSDICQKDDMMMLYNLYKEQNQFEMLLPNYFEDVRHNLKSIDVCTEINETKIQFQSTFSYFGFSGGVMITSKCILKRFPFENVGTYGPEDTYMFRNLFVNRKKVGLVSNFYVIHPFEEDKAWLEEKYEILKKIFMKVLERK